MITINSIAKAMCEGTSRSPKEMAALYKKFVQYVIDAVAAGEDVQLLGLCTFRWEHRGPYIKPVPPSPKHPKGALVEVPARRKLMVRLSERFKFKGAKKMSGGPYEGPDEGMEKYGVQLDDEKVKEASEGKPSKGICPICREPLDSGGACPVHGTEPFERRPG